MPDVSKCRSCDAPILWVETEATGTKPGRNMPVDANPDGTATVVPGGNLSFTGTISGNGKKIVRYVATGQGHHVSHFATCPHASEHRKRKR
jgi:hypothetical protein